MSSVPPMNRQRKRELRELNAQAWLGKKDLFKISGSLDSSLKKNTAVIKKLRTALNADSLAQLIKDFQTTSLEKYISEVVSAVAEGLMKVKTLPDINAAIEICSALHQRFNKDFTPQLTFALARGLATPRPEAIKNFTPDQKEREEKERLARHRILLRVAVELWLVGIVRTVEDAVSLDDGTATTTKTPTSGKAPAPILSVGKKRAPGDEFEPFPLEVLKDMLGRDKEHVSLPLVVLFVKHFSFDVLGIQAKDTSRKNVDEEGTVTNDVVNSEGGKDRRGSVAEKQEETTGEEPLTPPNVQTMFKNILKRYMDDVITHIKREHKYLQEQSVRNAEAYVRSGEIFEDRQANFEKRQKTQEKFVANAQAICDILGMEMPDLKDDTDKNQGSIIVNGTSMFHRGEGDKGIWEDDDERKFYEDLVDLKFKVPMILLEDKKKKTGEEGAEAKAEPEKKEPEPEERDLDDDFDFDGLSGDESEEKKKEDTEDSSTVIENKSIGAQVDALLIRLPEFTNRDLIDQAAVDFCFLNSKASRNRLLKTLQEIPRGRSDLLPYYARLIATLNQYLPDIGQGMLTYLDKEFRSLQRRKEKDLREIRSRNARYIAELTKFGIVPEHIIFHCLKVALDDFSRLNIEVLCNMLENCGKFLLRNPTTSPRMTQFLEILNRKKTAQHLGSQEMVLIENAFYFVNPPDRPAIRQKERSPEEWYVRKLIYTDLTKRNYIRTLKQLRKLHWEKPEIQKLLLKVFTKVWKLRYNNIFLLALLVVAMVRYHSDFSVLVVDTVLENIEDGLERNSFKDNQRRIATVKYLAELYNYKTIDSPVIFDALFRIVSFGHPNGMPTPGRYCPLDAPDDFFRIRLVCVILDTCGHCFDRGGPRKKMDFFLTFFQYYCATKDPLPMDMEFLLEDTYQHMRPSWKLLTNLEDAAKAFQEAVARQYKTPEKGAEEQHEEEEQEEHELSNDEMPDIEHDHHEDSHGSEGEDGSSSSDDSDAGRDSESEDDENSYVVKRPVEQRDPEADAEFDREFAKLMAESLESRKFERKQLLDVPLPIKRAPPPREGSSYETEARPAPVQASTPGKMAFSLLTKKGNKQQTSTIELPSDSTFAQAMKDKQAADREEKQRIKDLVLNYERMEEIQERESFEKSTGIPIKVGKQPQRARKLSLSDVNW
ncbi:nonsense-mediated mRNA decay factor [Ascobolus immersus RN42]|uniref:Nonsense-mediated mRNA decay factor n=1 Tax=Ascobolus immersus RN42 TaxID=1160509 RepID=A0A3N4H9C3_ASCIM|nr:nonsense-mediated mRNA decay factor [Ascobolus immersus RN42]